MSDRPHLVVDRIRKAYRDVVALADVSLSVGGRLLCRAARPSGSGKTTLLSVIGGFTVPTSGRIEIAGRDVTALDPAARPTTTVFQDYALFPHMSVANNVGFGLRVRGVPGAERLKRAEAALEMVGLGAFGSRGIHEMSGGQRQRVASPAPRGGAGDPAPRRAPRRPRPQSAPPDAGRAARAPEAHRPVLRPRHPRPGRGDGARHPRRRDEQGPHRGRRPAVAGLCPSGDPLHRRLHGREHADRGQGRRLPGRRGRGRDGDRALQRRRRGGGGQRGGADRAAGKHPRRRLRRRFPRRGPRPRGGVPGRPFPRHRRGRGGGQTFVLRLPPDAAPAEGAALMLSCRPSDLVLVTA